MSACITAIALLTWVYFLAVFHHFTLILHPKYSEKANLLVPLAILSNQPKAGLSTLLTKTGLV
jgi:hypothetical protein